MEDTEVDQGIGGHKEVGEEGGDNVELAHQDASKGDEEHTNIASDGVVVSPHAS